MALVTSPSLTLVTLPVARISVTSPATNPSPPVTLGLVRGVPSYGLLALSLVRFTCLGVMVRLPFSVFTSNSLVTTFPSLSVTTGVPVMLLV